jgi:hypothetical protein
MRIRNLIAAFVISLNIEQLSKASELLYVSMSDHTIVTFDTTGNVGSTIASTMSTFLINQSSLHTQRGLAFDSSGNLYVSNVGTNTGFISKFNSSGEFVSSITSNLNEPAGLAFDSAGNLYAANTHSKSISKFNSAGTYIGSITSSVQANLYGPYGLAFDSSGNLYTGNQYNSVGTISKFDPAGDFVNSFVSDPNGPSGGPAGLAFDSAGILYSANAGSQFNGQSISKFNSSGILIGKINDSSLKGAVGLAFDSLGNLYVSSIGNRKIFKYDSAGNFLTSWSTGLYSPSFIAFKPVSVPEPSTYILATIAASTLAYVAHRRKK